MKKLEPAGDHTTDPFAAQSRRRQSSMAKPYWWPANPYPKNIFPMPESRYPEIVPDPELRTSLSGMLGRRFWNIAAETIFEAMPKTWIPTNGTENLPPERQVVVVLFSLQPQYRFERHGMFEKIAHVVLEGDDRYWRIHGDPPGMLTLPAHVLYWYPLPDNPKKEGPQ